MKHLAHNVFSIPYEVKVFLRCKGEQGRKKKQFFLLYLVIFIIEKTLAVKIIICLAVLT